MVNPSKNDPQVLILGVGNILMSDEGAGVRAVEILQEKYTIPESVEIIDGGTSGMELLRFLENKEVVFIIDAIKKSGLKPGDVAVVDLIETPNFYRTRISPHQLGISDLLNIATLSNTLPKRIQLIGIVPKNIDTGLKLSGEVFIGIEKAISYLIDFLKDMGIILLPKMI
ncbi:HyaD/HybD family hydrogenase maturation endopeptidase [Desulfothermus okinawensis JCM 13304]